MHADAHGAGPVLFRRQLPNAYHLADGVGDDVAAIPGGLQRLPGFPGGGEVDVLGLHAAAGGQQHLVGRRGVRADAQRCQRPHHRRERVGLHGEQHAEAGKGIVQRCCLGGQRFVKIEVAGRVFPRQTENVFVHEGRSFLVVNLIVPYSGAERKTFLAPGIKMW